MKLRYYEKKSCFWSWDSWEECWHVTRFVLAPKVLQYLDEDTKSWKAVPVVVEEVGPGPKPKE